MSGPRYDRIREETERLLGYECQSCGWVAFPEERTICKRCGASDPGFEQVKLAPRGEIKTFVVQEFLPDEFEPPQPIAIVDIPQADGDGDPVRVYGVLTETALEELAIGDVVDARFRERFTDGERPINAVKFSTPREDKA